MDSRRQSSSDLVVTAAIYARVSSDDGRQTVANQVQQLHELAAARLFHIFREYLDEEPGVSAGRPSFLALLRDARMRRFRVHLVANLLIYHNMVSMTNALERLTTDGHAFDEDLVASISPYQTEHINRFGRYTLKRDRIPEPRDGVPVLRMLSRSEGLDRPQRRLCDNPTRILTVDVKRL